MDLDANSTWRSYFDCSAANCSYDSVYDATVDGGGGGLPEMEPEQYGQFMAMSRFWNKRVLYPIIMCVGVLGNGITIVILTRRRMHSSTNHYLTALAISDLFYLIFAFTLSFDSYPAMHTHAYFSYWCYALMLTDACSNTSVWLTVTFTIERYVAVCHPIRGKVLCTKSRAKRVVGAVVCACFLVVIPTPFEWVVVQAVDGRNRTMVRPEPSALGRDDTYRRAYYWFTSVAFVFLPLFLLAVFNSFLIRSVHQSKTQRRRMTMRGPRGGDGSSAQENRITIMLIAVVIMFLLCQLPTAVTLVYTSVYSVEDDPAARNLFRGLGNIFNSLVAVNAACNFVLYCAFSDKYRRIFLKTFVPCMFTKGSPLHSQSNVATGYSQVEIDSLGGSFRRGKPGSVRGASRKNGHGSPGLRVSIKHANGHGVNGHHGVNGSAKFQPRFLQVPLQDNGGVASAREDSIGSDSTADTTVSCSELVVLPAANGRSTTVSYHDSNKSSPASDGGQRRNRSSSGVTEQHVISLTSPNGNDHLL